MVTSLEPEDPKDAIRALTSCLNTETMLSLACRFSETYTRLAKHSTEHFLVTPVADLPTGKEKGKFLAIDVGGSNLRVGFVELAGELATHESGHRNAGDVDFAGINRSYDKSWLIEEHLKTDRPEDLFRWIGDCMAEVIREAIDDTPTLGDEEILLGVTFSFPIAQTSLSEATLLPMGKGFAITTDLHLGEMLLAGYARHLSASRTAILPCSDASRIMNGNSLPKIRVAAITNDTVATFVSLAYAVKVTPNRRVAMGLIVGTGTNAAVPMRLNDLHPSKSNAVPNTEAVTAIVNTEWTIRGTDEPLRALEIETDWDRILDENSDAPGFQPFEYMTSGRYLGEIVRLAFIDVVQTETDMHTIPHALQRKNAITTHFLSEIVACSQKDTLRTHLADKFPSNEIIDDSFWSQARVQLLCDIAQAVQQRSSALIAAACIGLLDCVGDISLKGGCATEPRVDGNASNEVLDAEELVIAYAGSTISQYPHWLEDCQKWLDELVNASGMSTTKSVVLREALDGGIIGAGVLAGMVDRLYDISCKE